jgi:hypothetical protein
MKSVTVTAFWLVKVLQLLIASSQLCILKICFVAKVEDNIPQTCPKLKFVFGLQLKRYKTCKDIASGILMTKQCRDSTTLT